MWGGFIEDLTDFPSRPVIQGPEWSRSSQRRSDRTASHLGRTYISYWRFWHFFL